MFNIDNREIQRRMLLKSAREKEDQEARMLAQQ